MNINIKTNGPIKQGINKMSTSNKLAFLTFFILFAACAPSLEKAGFEKIENPFRRIITNCVSVLPPQEEGWYLNPNIKTGRENKSYCKQTLAFLKRQEDTYQSYVFLIAAIFDLPDYKSDQEFLDLNTKAVEDDARHGSRFVVVESKHGLHKQENKYCTRHYFLVKDYGARKIRGKGNFIFMEEIKFICKYPYKPNEAVTISYSHKYYDPKYKDENFEKVGINYFNQVEFIE
jgi:hypothetical protein